MTTIKVDFSDVEQQDHSPIKSGKYDVVIEDIEVRQAEGKEHPYLNFKLMITDGEYEGRYLYAIGSTSPKAVWRLQEIFQSFGLEDDEYELEVDDDTNQLLSPDLIGEAAVATVRNQLYDGRPQPRVVSLVGGEGAPPKKKKPAKAKPADEDEEDEEEEEKPARRVVKKKPAAKAAKDEDEEEDEEEEDEEEEEEEKPAKRVVKKPAVKAKAKPAAKRRFR